MVFGALKQPIQRFTPEGLFIEKEYVGGYSVLDAEYRDALSESNRRIRSQGLGVKNDKGIAAFQNFFANMQIEMDGVKSLLNKFP